MISVSLSDLRRRYGAKASWYFAAIAALGVSLAGLCLALCFGYWLNAAEHQRTVGAKHARLQALSNEAAPLQQLRKDIGETRSSIAGFYSQRVPSGYSQIVSSLGEVAIRSGVSLSRVSYAQGTPGADVSEVSMEVGVAGDYAQLVRFVNGIERDHIFFVVRALSFTGQQGGDVTLQVRISTWLRSPVAGSIASESGATAPARSEASIHLAGAK